MQLGSRAESSHPGHNRKMGRVCPEIGRNTGALNSNEDAFVDPEQVNRMVINFSELKRVHDLPLGQNI